MIKIPKQLQRVYKNILYINYELRNDKWLSK